MGNKKKVGKQRRDKFYQLAKESGYRARSAFKLIQLNRKFEFLQNSKVVIDLCAAPGGWLQVCSENCPVSSLIVGVDLVAIKPIRNVTTLIDDITTDKCRQDLRKELQTWKADCVLNDGAPNVGKNWNHDAFQQVQLTLHALKLATEFLRKGGWFITKVFRSKDYNSLLWVFQQLFKNVHATKPQASRNESAEIFVVCQNYLAPDRIDPKFLDPKFVFKDIDDEPSQAINLMHPEKHTRHRGGYPEGDYTLFHSLNVSEFIKQDNFLELLANANEIKFDDKEIENHKLTTAEIKECLKDIKVLGKREIRLVISWRKKLKLEFEKDMKEKEVNEPEKIESDKDSEDDIAALEAKLADLEGEERKAMKRKIKKTRRERIKLQRKMDMKLVLPGDKIELTDDRELFDLNRIQSKRQLQKVEEVDLSDIDEVLDDEEEEVAPKKKKVVWERDAAKEYQLGDDSGEEEDSDRDDFGKDHDDDVEDDGEVSLEEAEEGDINPLIVGRPGKKAKTDFWFSKDSFAGLDDEEDEDVEIEKMAEAYKQKGGKIKGMEETDEMIIPEEKVEDIKQVKIEKEKKVDGEDSAVDLNSGQSDDDSDDETSSESSESDSDSDSDYDTKEFYKQQKESMKEKKSNKGKLEKTDDFEVVPGMKLDPKGLAIGAAMVSSRKRKRELIESGYHRYMFNDENLPDWFAKEEAKHYRVHLPVTKGEVEEYKLKMKAVDANPIKKIAEAKARKKRKEMRKLEKARKKADAINDTEEVTDREKWQQIKQVYKRAGLLNSKKKEVTYVVSKRGLAGKKVSRPQGVKGPYKVVDGRMKKDQRGMRRAEQRKKGKGKKRK